MKKDASVFAHHILDSINAIYSFLGDFTKSDLEKDRKSQNAIIRELEIIGEAVKNIPESVKLSHPDVPWKKIAGMRDKLIHHYFGISLDIIWDVLKYDLSQLKKQIQKILNERG